MSASKNNRTRNVTMLAAVIVAVVIVFGLRFRQLGQDQAQASIRDVHESEGVPVEVVAAEAHDLARWITLAGTVEGAIQYPVVSNNALQVVGIPVREGDHVEPGDVIIRLASGAPSPMYHSAAKSQASYDNTLVDVTRLRNLYAEGAVARATLDAAETKLKVAAADLADAEGSATLVASQAGTVSSILVTEGQTVKTGKPLAWVTDTDQVTVRFTAGNSQALEMATGQLARWSDANGVGEDGRVVQLDLMADPDTHLLEGEARFPNPRGRLLPGLLLSFQVRTDHRPGVLTVPRECLVTDAGGEAVWAVATGDDGIAHAELRSVRQGLAGPERIEIMAGLENGEQVVRHGQSLLVADARVKIISSAEVR